MRTHLLFLLNRNSRELSRLGHCKKRNLKARAIDKLHSHTTYITTYVTTTAVIPVPYLCVCITLLHQALTMEPRSKALKAWGVQIPVAFFLCVGVLVLSVQNTTSAPSKRAGNHRSPRPQGPLPSHLVRQSPVPEGEGPPAPAPIMYVLLFASHKFNVL